MTRVVLVLITSLASLASPAVAQTPRAPLKNVAADQIVREITYCRGEYRLTMASGDERRVRELNLRFKTDATAYGPERGKPVLLPAGMQGDRVQVIFASLDDLKRFLVERCEGVQR
jgi:cytochrome c